MLKLIKLKFLFCVVISQLDLTSSLSLLDPPKKYGPRKIERYGHLNVTLNATGKEPPLEPTTRSEDDDTTETRRSKRSEDSPKAAAKSNKVDLNETSNQLLIHWAGNEVILLLAKDVGSFDSKTVSNSTMYFSYDYGISFKPKISTNMSYVNEHEALKGKVNQYESIPGNTEYFIMTDSANKVIYITLDAGRSIQTVADLPFHPDKIVLHPLFLHLVIALDQTHENRDLYLSEDQGFTWRKIQTGVKDAYWGHNPEDKLQTVDEARALYVERHEPGKMITVLKTHDFNQFNPVISNVLEFVIANNTMFVLTTSDYNATAKDLWIAPSRVEAFSKVVFNGYRRDSFQDYIIVDSSESQVLVIALAQQKAHLFMSEPNMVDFTLSIENVRRVEESYRPAMRPEPRPYDVYKVEGLRSVFIVNVEKQQNKRSDMVTLITFDKGAIWQQIPTPPIDSHGNPYPNTSTLELYQSHTYDLPHFVAFSSSSAPGYVLAEGSVVSQSVNPRPNGVFFSSDGGRIFKEVMYGNYHMVWVDHGGAIALISKYQTTKTLWLSVNGGDDWINVTISDKLLRIYGMLTEPGETSTIITVFGSATISMFDDFSWTIVQVDVRDLLGKKCEAGDYQTWSMSDENGDNCIMGTRDEYSRRIMKNVCMNDRSYDRPKSSKVCQCRRKDFECDVGYIKTPQRSFHPCEPDSRNPIDQVPATCKPGTLYSKSNGYRKLAGDKCSGGQEEYLSPRALPCPFFEEQSFMVYMTYGGSDVRIYNLLTKDDEVWFSSPELEAFDFDFPTNCVFYTLSNSPAISRRCFDPLLATPTWKMVIQTPSNLNMPVALAFDWLAGNLYWITEDGQLSVSDREGQAIRKFNFTESATESGLVYNATHIVLDPTNQAMYTSHFDAAKQSCDIVQHGMDGRGSWKLIFRDSCSSPYILHSLVLDHESSTLYWVYNRTIKSYTNVDSGHVRVVDIVQSVDITDSVPVAVFKNKLLIGSSGGIWENEKYVSDVASKDFDLQVKNLQHMKVFSKHWQTSATENPCKGHSCQHLCLLGQNQNKTTCMCGNNGEMLINFDANNQEICVCPISQIFKNGFCTSPDGEKCIINEEFKCMTSGRCIPSTKACDGNNDCPDASDELGCSFCTDDDFKCNSSVHCIPKMWVCDGENDCDDGSDESKCSERNCTTDQFRCHSTGACIAASFQCDGELDCKDESDEKGCIDISDKSDNDACWSSEFQCPTNTTSSPTCISFEQLCDGNRDCPDGADESAERCNRANKTCHAIEFQCANGKCIFDWLYCNGEDNCGDNSDEKNCTDVRPSVPAPTPAVDPTNQCPNGHLRCRSSGHCYPLQWACDGVDDCGDSSDEFDCEQSETNHTNGMLVPCYPNFSQFKCSTGGKCIFLHLKCDGDNDCLDWSDEKDCPDFKRADADECVINSGIGYKGTRNYTKNGYRCQRWDSSTPHDPHYRPLDEHNNYCRNPDNDPTGPWCYTTNPDKRWDYCAIPFCSNTTGAPTGNIPSRTETVYCADGYISCGGNESSNCILSRFACDGESDCGNGSDEEYCETEVCDVSNGKFKCSNGLCISNHLKCNGFDDCDDNSDELNCPIKCLLGSFRCRHEHDKCIEMHRLCDGVQDCSDGSDEELCGGNTSEDPRTYRCKTSGKEIDNSQVCDFHLDCKDKSDESQCMCAYGYETYPVSAADVGNVLIPKTVKRKVEVKCSSKPSDAYLIYLYYKPVEEGNQITNFSNAAMMKFTKYPRDNYFTINSLAYNTRYCFSLSFRINGVTLPPTVSENSLQHKCFRTQEGVPDVPTNIHFAHQADRRRAVLIWQRPDVTNGKVTKYAIKVSTTYGDKILYKKSTSAKEENYELERISYFDTEITVSVAAYTAAGRGQFSKSVTKSLLSRREKTLISTTHNITRTCVTLQWHQPSSPQPFTGQYLICMKSQWNQTALTSSGNSNTTKHLTKRICHLAPGELYGVTVTPIETDEGVDISYCADERFHHFSTVSPRVATPSIDVSKSHATGVDSVQLVWSSMADSLNKTKVVYQIQYGSNVQRSSLHDKFVSGNTVEISKLRHNTHSVFRIRIVQPFEGPWSDYVLLLPTHDHTTSPRDLKVTSNRRGGYTATWISPYDDDELTETYMLQLINKDSGKTVERKRVPCSQFRCSYTYTSIRDYAVYEVQVNLIMKGDSNGTVASFNFYTGSEVDPIDDLHLYRDDITSAKLLYHIPERFEDFYRNHLMDVKVLLCESSQDHVTDDDCVHEPQLNISSHQITIKDLEFDKRYHIHLKPECQHNVDYCPRESQLYFTFGDSEILNEPDAARSSKPLGRMDVISIAVSATFVLLMIVCIIAYLMRRRRNQSVNYVGMTSRYNSQSGEAFFVADDAPFNSGGLLDDEVDTPMISGFNDDEPLIVA